MTDYIYGSVCRITNLNSQKFTVNKISKNHWETGNFVLGTVSRRPSHKARIEAPSGRTVEPLKGDKIIGALGTRKATRGIVGDWRSIDPESGIMNIIGGGGIIGKVTSLSPYLHEPIELKYDGHIVQNDDPVSMSDFVGYEPSDPIDHPIILVLGTSMSSGKTMSARVIIQALRQLGHQPFASKLSGSGRYHDILSMKDAGADRVFDFVDAGLPTTVVPRKLYKKRIEALLQHIQSFSPDVTVVEIGASPLEPYNGDLAIELLKESVIYSVLTASDPYSVIGLTDAFEIEIDLVTGIATNTKAGIDLIKQLTGLTAVNLQNENEKTKVKQELENRL